MADRDCKVSLPVVDFELPPPEPEKSRAARVPVTGTEDRIKEKVNDGSENN